MHLDPQTPVERTIDGTTYLIRILTQREMARYAVHSHAIRARLMAAPDGEAVVLEEDDIARIERCLQLGIAGWVEGSKQADGSDMPPWEADGEGPRHMAADLLDAIPFASWMEINTEIAAANQLTKGEAKNSSSPPQ